MSIDYEAVRSAIRAELLAAEIVIITATGEYVGIRDGEYNASIHTRPDAPAERPILSATDVAWEGWEFDRTGKDLYYDEFMLPSADFFEASRTEKLTGIYQLTVWAKKGSKAGQKTQTANKIAGDKAKYIRELFSRYNDNLSPSQTGMSDGLVITTALAGPAIPDETYYGIPISLSFSAYLTST